MFTFQYIPFGSGVRVSASLSIYGEKMKLKYVKMCEIILAS